MNRLRTMSLRERMFRMVFSERALFTGSKLVGLFIRPLILLIALRTGKSELANDFGLLLTAVASSFIILNNQNYRTIYQYFLGDNRTAGGKGIGGKDHFRTYLTDTILHILLFYAVVLIALSFWTDNYFLLFQAALLVLVEKYYDDDQRILVYKRKYIEWVANFSFRIILPSTILIIVVVTDVLNKPIVYTISAVLGTIAYIILFRRKFISVFFKTVKNIVSAKFLNLLKGYIIRYKREFFLAQVWSYLGSNVIMVDRFSINHTNTAIFAEYLFLVNIANAVQTLHNMGYVTFIRPNLIKNRTSILRSSFSLLNWGIPAIIIFGIFVVFLISRYFGITLSTLPSSLILAVCSLYLMHAVSLIPKEIAFWRLKRGYLIMQELLVFIFPAIAYFSGFHRPLEIVCATLIGVIMRFVAVISMVQWASGRDSKFAIS